MPYDIVKRGDQYCVVRAAEGGRPQRTLGCHPTREQAEKQRQAIGANSEAEASTQRFGG